MADDYALRRALELRDQARNQADRYRGQKNAIQRDLNDVATFSASARAREMAKALLDKHFPPGPRKDDT